MSNEFNIVDFKPTTGWFNFYRGEDAEDVKGIFRQPCPGIVKVQVCDSSTGEVYRTEWKAASIWEGDLEVADETSGYLDTRLSADEHWVRVEDFKN